MGGLSEPLNSQGARAAAQLFGGNEAVWTEGNRVPSIAKKTKLCSGTTPVATCLQVTYIWPSRWSPYRLHVVPFGSPPWDTQQQFLPGHGSQ